MDAEGRVVEFNPAAERTFGYCQSDVVGRPLADLIIPPDLRQKHRDGLARHRETGHHTVLGRRLEMRAMRADGAQFPVELAITQIQERRPGVAHRFRPRHQRPQAGRGRLATAERRTGGARAAAHDRAAGGGG